MHKFTIDTNTGTAHARFIITVQHTDHFQRARKCNVECGKPILTMSFSLVKTERTQERKELIESELNERWCETAHLGSEQCTVI